MFCVDYLQNSMVGWHIKRKNFRGAWVAHSVKRLISTQVLISSPMLGSTKKKKNLEQRSKQNFTSLLPSC